MSKYTATRLRKEAEKNRRISADNLWNYFYMLTNRDKKLTKKEWKFLSDLILSYANTSFDAGYDYYG